MIQQNYSLRKRQFRNLSNRINDLMKSQQWQKLSQAQQTRLAGRLHKLFGQIRSFFTKRELKKVLAGAAMLIGLSGAVQAQDFAAPVQNAFSLMPVVDLAIPNLVDIDGDGDLDMFISEYGTGNSPSLVYFENEGTASDPIFGMPDKNPFNFISNSEYYIFPSFEDIDDDGDFDMMSIGYTNATGVALLYHENVGTPTAPDFGTQQINPFGFTNNPNAFNLIRPVLADFDNDGDFDLIVGGGAYSSYTGIIQYYENTGTSSSPVFTLQTSLFAPVPGGDYLFPTVGDIDQDGDLDVLAGGQYGVMYFYENVGSASSATFGGAQTNPFGISSTYYYALPTLGDIDADGDLDLFVGEYYGNTQFFENLAMEVAVQNPEKESALQIFPNPASKQITIELEGQHDNIHLSIINELGMKVKQQVLSNGQRTLNIEDLPTGFYMVELKTENEQMIKKLIVK